VRSGPSSFLKAGSTGVAWASLARVNPRNAAARHLTTRGVSKAAPADLIKVEGVSAQLAQRIHDYFNKG